MALLELLETDHGLFQTALARCDATVLIDILDLNINYVLIERHLPHPEIEWVDAVFPLSDRSLLLPSKRRIRRMSADVLMKTGDFIASIEEFAHSGLDLFQLHKMPNTLSLSEISDHVRAKLYEELGVHFRLVLPHADEVGVISSASRASIEKIISKLQERSRS